MHSCEPLKSCKLGMCILFCLIHISRGRGGRVLPYKSLLGMCRWMGLIDYNGVAFLVVTSIRMGSHIFGISGIRKFW